MFPRPLSYPYFVTRGVNGLLRKETQHPVLSWNTANGKGCRWSGVRAEEGAAEWRGW